MKLYYILLLFLLTLGPLHAWEKYVMYAIETEEPLQVESIRMLYTYANGKRFEHVERGAAFTNRHGRTEYKSLLTPEKRTHCWTINIAQCLDTDFWGNCIETDDAYPIYITVNTGDPNLGSVSTEMVRTYENLNLLIKKDGTVRYKGGSIKCP